MESHEALVRVELVLGVFVALVAIARVARRWSVPLPVLLVFAGFAWGLVAPHVHGLQPLTVKPDLVFLVFLPPLLVDAATDVPFASFRRNLAPIAYLAVGLVLVTTAVVALVTRALLPAVPLGAAFVVGAIVAPPDPVAATSIARRVGFPNRLTTILEGEGLVNDATSLTALRLALLATAAGTFSFATAAQTFVSATAGGIAIGWGIGVLATGVLRRIDEPATEITLTLLLPYLAYAVAEHLQTSGVLSAVTLGFVLRRGIHDFHRAQTRLHAYAVWDTAVFAIEGLVFMLLGYAVGDIVAHGVAWRTVGVGLLVAGVAIAIRMVWMMIVPVALRMISKSFAERHPLPSFRERLVVGWAGMRGVVSLAAALAIPYSIADHKFPMRSDLVLISFVAIFVTLVLPGLTLPALIRALEVGDPSARTHEEQRAREAAERAARERLAQLAHEGRIRDAVVTEVLRRFDETEDDDYRRAVRIALDTERDVLEKLRDDGEINGDVVEELERELDAHDVRLASRRRRRASRSTA